MKLLRISLASLAACTVLAAPAHAASGNGLYEPFPSPQSDVAARDFVDALPGGIRLIDLKARDLGRGVLVGPVAVRAYAAGRAPLERASSGTRFAPSFGWPLALLLLAGAVGAAALASRRRA